MAWKKDDNGAFILDGENPIWVTDSGEEKSVDYLAMSKSLRETSTESRQRKERLRELEDKYALFKDIEDLAVWKAEADKAFESVKNMSEKDKEIEAQIAEKVAAATGNLKAQMAEKDKILGEKNQIITDQTNRLNTLLVKTAVQSSKTLNEEVNPKFRALVRRELERAGRVDKEGNIYFVNDANAKILAGDDAHDANADEAIREIIKGLGMDDKDFIMSPNDQHGSGAQPNPNGGNFNPKGKKYSEMSQEEKIAYLKDAANLKNQR